MSRVELDGVLLAYAVENVPDGGFEGVEIGVGFRPEPLVLHFAPERFDFVEVGAVGGQIENIHVLGLPRLEPRLEGGGVVNFALSSTSTVGRVRVAAQASSVLF